MILKTLLEKGGIDLPQRSILRLSTDPDVLPPHNPCFCPETYQPDMSPGQRRNSQKQGKQNIKATV